MSLKEFMDKKLEESVDVSGNLLKNLIQLIGDYVNSEYMISDDEKKELIDNLKIRAESHNKGVWEKGPKFVATSIYKKDGKINQNIEILVEITTTKF
jgi:hypothetical protein